MSLREDLEDLQAAQGLTCWTHPDATDHDLKYLIWLCTPRERLHSFYKPTGIKTQIGGHSTRVQMGRNGITVRPLAGKSMAHTCHWPGCKKHVPPKLWGCKDHWFRLPKKLRDWIWATYVPGQEITKTPSREYLEAAMAVEKWCLEENRKEKSSLDEDGW